MNGISVFSPSNWLIGFGLYRSRPVREIDLAAGTRCLILVRLGSMPLSPRRIIIAHRLSTVRRANRIITVERGRIIEDGTHDELIRSGGRYAMLFRIQAGIHEVR